MSIRAAGHQRVQPAVPGISEMGTRMYADVAKFERVLVAASLSKVNERPRATLAQTLVSLPAIRAERLDESIKAPDHRPVVLRGLHGCDTGICTRVYRCGTATGVTHYSSDRTSAPVLHRY